MILSRNIYKTNKKIMTANRIYIGILITKLNVHNGTNLTKSLNLDKDIEKLCRTQ